MIASWDLHCEANTKWVMAESCRATLRTWDASQARDMAPEGTHISSEGPGKPPEHKKREDAEEPPLEGTLGG